jgi:hypothetical protein
VPKVRGTIHGAPMGGWEFAKAMVDMSQWLQSTGCRLNKPMLSGRSLDTMRHQLEEGRWCYAFTNSGLIL